jgi:hypothetical protein
MFRPGGKTNIEVVRFGLGDDNIHVEHLNYIDINCVNISECSSPANIRVGGKGEQTTGAIAVNEFTLRPTDGTSGIFDPYWL